MNLNIFNRDVLNFNINKVDTINYNEDFEDTVEKEEREERDERDERDGKDEKTNFYNYENFNNFLNLYKNIANDDFMKKQYFNTSHFKHKKSNKHNKYLKNHKNIEKTPFTNAQNLKTWCLSNYDLDYNDKTILFIKSMLNKINDDNYSVISSELITGLIGMEYDIIIFDVIINEIIEKCIQDDKYRDLYVNLLNMLWSNNEFHYKLFNINSETNVSNELNSSDINEMIDVDVIVTTTTKYFISDKKKNDKLNMEFNELAEVHEFILSNFSFKHYFIDHIQTIFQKLNFNQTIGLEQSQEDYDNELMKNKKYVLSIINIIVLMYNNGYIGYNIICVIVLNLLHLNNNFDNVSDLEYESLYNLIKYIQKSIFQLPFFTEIVSILTEIVKSESVSKRIQFYLNDSSKIIRKCLG